MRRQGIDKVSQLKKESWILKITLSVLLVAIFLPNVAMHVLKKYNTGQLFGLDGIKADNPIKAKQGSSDASNY